MSCRRLAIAAVGLIASAASTPAAHADDNDYAGGTVIFARGGSLIRTDPRGKGETELAKLPAKVSIRALRTDATGSVLLVDLGGKWSWMPLDGSRSSLADLPCVDGPAQLATDGACVLCRAASGSIIVNLKSGKQAAVDIPAPGARLTGAGAERKLVWADATGIWASPPGNAKLKTQLGAEAPLRGFLPSPSGARAVGVYLDQEHDGKQTKPAEFLMGFALDGQAARRKGIKAGVPVEWSHDSDWVLVQDGARACIMKAMGGQYKCWKGYTAASISSDGKWALILGNRDGSKKQAKPDPKTGTAKTKAKAKAKTKDPEPTDEPELDEEAPAPGDDVAVAPPGGPLALYRAQLEGAFTASPALIVQVVDGAAVWVPAAPH